MALNDELWSGVTVVAAPAVEAEQRVSHSGYTLLVFVIPLIVSALLEAGIALVSDRLPRRWLVAAGLASLSAALIGCAYARSGYELALGLGLAGTASGVACAAAAAELVTSNSAGAERALTRWTFFGAVGDVLTPVVIGASYAFGASYRLALSLMAAITVCLALAVARDAWRRRAERRLESPPEDEEQLSLSQALAVGARNRELWSWAFGAAVCTLLDEIVIALATLRIEQELGQARSSATACATLISLGAVVGSFTSERLLARFGSTRVLVASAALCAVALVGVVVAPSFALLLPCLFAVGFSAAPQFALLEARTYATMPGRPGVVNALTTAFVVIDVGAPYALGSIADRFGLGVALLTLLAQPLTVLLLVMLVRRSAPRPT